MSVKKFFFSDSKVGAVDGYVLENEQVSLTVLSFKNTFTAGRISSADLTLRMSIWKAPATTVL